MTKVGLTNNLLDLLKYWHKVEHFSPYEPKTINSESFRRIKILDERSFPWEKENIYERVYTVYFGMFKLNDTNEIIEESFGATEILPEESQTISCMCTFKINDSLIYIEDSFRLSSLAWAVGQVKNDNLILDTWANDFDNFECKIGMYLHNAKTEWSLELFKNFKNFIDLEIGWDIPYCDIWMYIDERKLEKIKSTYKENIKNQGKFQVPNGDEDASNEQDDENSFDIEDIFEQKNQLLNSFYVRDLEKIIKEVERNNYGKGFSSFIESKQSQRIDIQNSINEIKKCISPKDIPLGRWPSEYNLSLMQQVAVNIAKSKELVQEGLFSVNGPPGTGKTTLLRDIISSIIVDRAKVLAEFTSPEKAFKPLESIEVGSYSYTIYELDGALKDFGILVASNNNGAVENITIELPEISAIPKKYRELSEYGYFSDEAKNIYNNNSWALISAALGNSKNCRKFTKKFWNIDKSNPCHSLREALYEGKYNVLPWDEAVKKFMEKYDRVLAKREKLVYYEENLNLFDKYKEQLSKLENENDISETRISLIKTEITNFEKMISDVAEMVSLSNQVYNICKEKYTIIQKLLFFTAESKKLKDEFLGARKKYEIVLKEHIELQTAIKNKQQEMDIWIRERRNVIDGITKVQHQIETITPILDQARNDLKQNFPDFQYWAEFETSAQINCPWISEDFNIAREELFLEALALHKSFILNSKAMKNNLNLFYNLLSGRLKNKDEIKYSGILLQSIFVLIPVISTTFASIGKFLKHVGKEEIGWLLIDEAGQGTPQSAVGAIWRSKKTIVVGDPLQIEPVVTVPQVVLDRFAKMYQVSEKYTNKTISIQILADEHNRYGTYRNDGILWVGCPLRVHRRCINPMFDIANTIAYDGKMICATNSPKDKEFVIERCSWLGIGGRTDTPHYIPEQGEHIFGLISKHFLQIEDNNPSLYIITPFISVKNELIKLLSEEDKLYNNLISIGKRIGKKDVDKWILKNVGTVHTFQGKEADVVILCLGCDSYNKGGGAANWAASKPNILNVAVTRAKYRLIIIGDLRLWKGLDYFNTAYSKITGDTLK